MFCELNTLHTESDVEQKLIYPFLSTKEPIGLGFYDEEIYTKKCLKSYVIGKSNKKNYYPDYLVMIKGLPVLIVEAKTVGEDLCEAYREARLYASEINSRYPHNKNICSKIIVSNGNELWAGFYDEEKPKYRILFDDFQTENNKYVEIINFASRRNIVLEVDKIYSIIRSDAKFFKPVTALGGKRAQNEELSENPLGQALLYENIRLFDPQTEPERVSIVENAYVKSYKRETHAEPLYKEIKRFRIPSIDNVMELPTDNPQLMVNAVAKKIQSNEYDENSLVLLIGNVGSGKSTFVRYFQNVYLKEKEKDLYKNTLWLYINLNDAPLSKESIYNWVITSIIDQIKYNSKTNVDYECIDVIQKIFDREIQTFKKGIGSLLCGEEYNKALFDELKILMKDNYQYLVALFRYVKKYLQLVPIIVLDNCDKRNKDDQLLMFEVAQWLKKTYSLLVILPMRDLTYDLYKDEPPLDTVVKDLVFRIDPPDFLKVIQARLNYLIRIKDNKNSIQMQMKNGMIQNISPNEYIEYFKCIIMEIRNNDWVKNIFYKLTNKDIRKGIQIFIDLCRSGHIGVDDLFITKATYNEISIPTHKLINALLRKNRKFYSEQTSNFINMFASKYTDTIPDPFIRVDMLNYLFNLKDKITINGYKGYCQIKELIQSLEAVGHDIDVIKRELNFLTENKLILGENNNIVINSNDLIKISYSGIFYMSLLKNMTYLEACSEDVEFKDTTIMKQIAERLASKNYLTNEIAYMSVKDMISYLQAYRESFIEDSSICLNEKYAQKIYNFEECLEAIDTYEINNPIIKEVCLYKSKICQSIIYEADVIRKKQGSLIVLINEKMKGFLSIFEPEYELSENDYESINEGDQIKVIIIEYDYDHLNFHLAYKGKV